MCLKRFNLTRCPNCGGHLASIDHGLRECEQCGRIQGANPMTNPAATPQPMPTVGKQDVLPEVIADLQARTAVGVVKYGTPLQSHNGRDCLTDAYQEALDLAQYLKQALLERDNPAPEYNWPEVKFARSNSLAEQLAHILSEVDEITELGPPITPLVHLELADLHHNLETFWRILAKLAGDDYVAALFQGTEDKNRARGYYDLDGDAAPVDRLEGHFGEMPYVG
jgi:hypothetical protein